MGSSGRIIFHKCEGYSFFDLAERLFPEKFSRLPFQRICGMMRKLNAQCLSIQTHLQDLKDFHKSFKATYEEIEHLRKVYGTQKRFVTVTQICYFSKNFRTNRKSLPDDIKPKDVLGSCIIISILPKSKSDLDDAVHSFLFEAVIKLPSHVKPRLRGSKKIPFQNHYYHVAANCDIIVCNRTFAIKGLIFTQQNGKTSVCAHSAIKMALWHTTNNRYLPSTVDINRFLEEKRRGSTHVVTLSNGIKKPLNEVKPSDGMLVEEIIEYCKQNNTRIWMLKCGGRNSSDAYEYSNLLMESGVPAIAIISQRVNNQCVSHVLPIIGYTLNSDKWLPLAHDPIGGFAPQAFNAQNDKYLSSSEWTSHLIVNDDMIGPCLCVAPDTLKYRKGKHNVVYGHVTHVIGIVSMDLPIIEAPYRAGLIAGIYFWEYWNTFKKLEFPNVSHSWAERFKKEPFNEKNLVLRTQIVHTDNYIHHLLNIKDHKGKKCRLTETQCEYLREILPEYVWMTEYSSPALFCDNHAKLGEFLLWPDLIKDELLAKRKLTDTFAFRILGNLEIVSDKRDLELGFETHTPLYEREPREIEW